MESEENQKKKGNIRGVSELIRVAAGLLTHHFCHRLCRAIDKAQRVCLVKELVIESDHSVSYLGQRFYFQEK